MKFVYQSLPGRVLFGAGSIDALPAELDALGATRVLVLCTERQRRRAEALIAGLGDRVAGVYDGAVMHVPVETRDAAAAEARRTGADACLAIGGGSTIGLAKALALELALPIVCVPTTYSGSEMTTIWGLTEGGAKTVGRDPAVLPRAVIYEPALTLDLPPAVAATSGINAVAHCVEGLYAENANPVTGWMAEEGIRSLARALPGVVAAPDDLAARSDALYGAWLAGMVLGASAMALHHKLCHVLGGSFNLPHAETHTVVLPHAAAYNRAAAPEAMARVARALGAADAPTGLFELARRIGAGTALRDIGMKEEDLDRAAEIAVGSPYYNPRPVTREGVRALLDDAFYGRPPASA